MRQTFVHVDAFVAEFARLGMTDAQKRRAKAVAGRYAAHLERLATDPVKRLER